MPSNDDSSNTAMGMKRITGPSHLTPMIVHPVRFLWMNRSTHSDVMATSTTTEITALGGATKLPSSNSSSHNAIQLPSFLGKHLPSHVSVPSKRKARALVKERDIFMQRLEQERNDRAVLETWAVIRGQALVRGHLGRLRVDRIRQQRGMKLTEAARRRKEDKTRRDARKAQPQMEQSEFDAEQLRAQLAQLTAETDMYMELIGSASQRPEWTKHVKNRSEGKKERRKRRTMEKMAVRNIQRVARGFLGRRAAAHLRRRTKEYDQFRSSVRIQTQIRRVLSTARVDAVRYKRRTQATIVLQRRARGWFGRVFARMYKIRLENIQLEDSSAFKIQSSWRRYLTNAHQYRLDQEAAARKIQAIARGRRGREDFESKALLKEEELEASIRIQAAFRARAANQRVNDVRQDRQKAMLSRQHEQAAACKMQALHRGKNAREAYKQRVSTRREKAALAIQNRSRQRRAKAKVARKKQYRSESNAAKSIQRIHRGKRGRKNFQEKRAQQALALEHEMERIEQDRLVAHDDEVEELRMEEAAIARAEAEKEERDREQLAAAQKIQSIQRGKRGRAAAQRRAAEKARLEALRIEEQKRATAITRIQAAQRRKAARVTVERARAERLESLQLDTQLGAVRRRVQEKDSDDEEEDEE